MQFTELEKGTIISTVREILNGRYIAFAPELHPQAVRFETAGLPNTFAGWAGIYVVKQLLHKFGLVDILKQKHAWRDELLGGVLFTIRVLEDILDVLDCDRIRAELGSAWMSSVAFKKIAQRINVQFLVNAPSDNDEFHMVLANKVVRWHSVEHWRMSSFWWENTIGTYCKDHPMQVSGSLIELLGNKLGSNAAQNEVDRRHIN